MSESWTVELTGPARRSLQHELPEAVAWAASTYIAERLPSNPYQLGGELSALFGMLLMAVGVALLAL